MICGFSWTLFFKQGVVKIISNVGWKETIRKELEFENYWSVAIPDL